MFTDEHFMQQALREAQKAFDADEVPVGAVIVSQNKIIGRGHNLCERLQDPTAHAEMQAFTAATNYMGGKSLEHCTLYVTLEPCVMCAGAAYWTQVSRIVCGARDTKRGFSNLQKNILHPKTSIEYGLFENECSDLLKTFFKNKRD